MPAFNSVNIKDLTKIEEVVSGNLLIVETENGTNTIDFDNFVVGPDNVSWYTAFETVSGQVATLSADLGQVNFTERSALTALSAEVQLLETQFYALTSNVNALSSNFLALSSNLINPAAIVLTTGDTSSTFPTRWNTAKVTVIGGGGGGGGGGSGATHTAGAGGGAGGIAVGYFTNIGGRTYRYKVGIGGSGGTGAAGGTGIIGDVTHLTVPVFGANFGVSGNGGGGGNGNNTNSSVVGGGAGGTGTGDSRVLAYNFTGAVGFPGVPNTTLANAFGGNGANGYLGIGAGIGASQLSNNINAAGGSASSSTGAGGGGGRGSASGAVAGGAGGSGIIIIEFVA